jgi:hypothetical protein
VLVLVILLIVTNLVTLGVLAWFLLRPADHSAPDGATAAALAALSATPLPPVSSSGTRRLITIEILNPIELAGTRGRLAGIAGSLAPGTTRRLVYDQALKLVKRQLAHEHVVADVRLQVIGPKDAAPRPSVPVSVHPVPARGPEPARGDFVEHEDAEPGS